MGQYLLFKISGEEFGIGLDKVFEILKSQKAIPCPGTPGYIKGIFDLRGTVVPLMDIRIRLGVEPSTENEKIIIVYIHNEKIGLLVDDIDEIITIDDEKIASPPSIFKGLKPEYLQGIGNLPDRLIIILNLDNLMTTEEIKMLGDISDISFKAKEGDSEIG